MIDGPMSWPEAVALCVVVISFVVAIGFLTGAIKIEWKRGPKG